MSTSKKQPRARQLLSVETFRSHAAEDVLKAALEELGWKNVQCHVYMSLFIYKNAIITEHAVIFLRSQLQVVVSLHEGVWIWPVFFTNAGAPSPTLNYDVTSSG